MEEVERTKEYLTRGLGERFTRNPNIASVPTWLHWTVFLPGFDEALESAFNAHTTLTAENSFFRAMAKASSREENERLSCEESELVYAEARLRARPDSIDAVFAEFMRDAPETIYKHSLRLGNAAKDGKKNKGTNIEYFDAVAKAWSVSKKDLEPWTVVDRKTQLIREFVAYSWIKGAFWLADSQQILNFLRQSKAIAPAFFELGVPASYTTVLDWINSLKLESYKGKGKLIFFKNLGLLPDDTLFEEVGVAVRSVMTFSRDLSDLELGKRFHEGCRHKFLQEKGLEL